ncbi:hypothetical protein CKO31_07845 [Thiohalocapsa halophila]|uniref:PEP-CTERM sorting domain-containing protein n=1 Tax=Thiohalocapsa halophila TaxID=69359 RepID=A0ABS1CFQ4_9GAMM|nr:DUF1566 domain-containing protein [Thiohalocapsa halophila]MBK1630657.1 hypothetical protein [Thiohalocapsa halophila]
MQPLITKRLVLAAGLMLWGACTQAALMPYESGGVQLVYDDAQDLTWTRDANLFKTQYDADNTVIADIIAAVPTITSGNGTHNVVTGDFNTINGRMTWYGAMAWVEWLGSIAYAGADDWRLPAIIDTGAPGFVFAYVGSDAGYNVDTSSSEVAHLWYDTLDNIAFFDTSGGIHQPGWGLSNAGPFGISMQDSAYWSGTEYPPNRNVAMLFHAGRGQQYGPVKDIEFYGWAVRPGQIAAAPVPGTAALLALGLMGIGARKLGSSGNGGFAAFREQCF